MVLTTRDTWESYCGLTLGRLENDTESETTSGIQYYKVSIAAASMVRAQAQDHMNSLFTYPDTKLSRGVSRELPTGLASFPWLEWDLRSTVIYYYL
jgi:hypothetical protein